MSIRKKVIVIVIAVVILAALGGGVFTVIRNKVASTNNAPLVFANNRMLLELWSRYKQTTLEPGSLRALDKSQNSITTSEGQSYTMLRSVWMDDLETFQTSWKWTQANLQRPDKLMSWKYGQRADKTYGILTDVGGQNTASDADIDIAFALTMAAGRWHNQQYLDDARAIIQSIWANEVVAINNKPILVANNLESANLTSVIVNPSYFSPYAFRTFQKIDPAHDWSGVVNSSYDILLAAGNNPLDKKTASGLTPDWIRIDRTTGAIIPAPEYTSDYGYEALRTPWRLALDYKWYKDDRAKQVLSKYDAVLEKQYNDTNSLAAVYNHDGTIKANYASPAMYGTALAYFDVVHPDQVNNFYTRSILPYYNPDTQSWKTQLSYYDDNWVWFGMALHDGVLVNLTEQIND